VWNRSQIWWGRRNLVTAKTEEITQPFFLQIRKMISIVSLPPALRLLWRFLSNSVAEAAKQTARELRVKYASVFKRNDK
jgi:hypothetical protein